MTKVTLKDFQIVKELGEGKFGTVFLARHIKIQSFLDHPNICQLYTYFLENDFIYLVLELCNSGNVYNVLRKVGRFTEDKVKSIIRQVCHAI
jgi:serine/threonine protein kinase